MGRSQVLFNRRKSGRGGGRAGGRQQTSVRREQQEVVPKKGGEGRRGRGDGAPPESLGGRELHGDNKIHHANHSWNEQKEHGRSLSSSDINAGDTTEDQQTTDNDSLHDLWTNTMQLQSATTATYSTASFGGNAVNNEDEERVQQYEDDDLTSQFSRSSFQLASLNGTLKKLSLQERFKIPQHLIDTLYVDTQAKGGLVTDVMPSSSPPLPPIVISSEPVPSLSAGDPQKVVVSQEHPRPSSSQLRRIASLSSRGTSTASVAYDGDDDSDAILRSRRSSDDDGEGSTLPSLGENLVVRSSNLSFEQGRREGDLESTTTTRAIVMEGKRVEDSPAVVPKVTNSMQSSDGVAAIIQSISEELYLVDQVVSPDGDDVYMSDEVDGTSSLLAVASNRGVIPPSDTMQAVVGTTTTSTTTSTSRLGNLLPSDTTHAIAESATHTSSMGGVIRHSDTMQAVVNGKPVSSADRTTANALFPPNLLMSVTIPSPSTQATLVRKTQSIPSPTIVRRHPQPHSLLNLRSEPPVAALPLSPGRIPDFPIDLSEAPSPPNDDNHNHQHPFSVPEDRIRAMNEDARNPTVTSINQAPSPARLRRSVSSSARREDGDAIEQARINVQPDTTLTPTSNSTHGDVLVQGMRRLLVDSAVSKQKVTRSYRDGGASSKEPDSDAAVVQSHNSSTLVSHHHHLQSTSRPQTTKTTTITASWTHQQQQHPDDDPNHFHTAMTPKTKSSSFSRQPQPQHERAFFPENNEKVEQSRSQDEDYDLWLDSALATQTFEKNSDEPEESLNEWLDSVIP